MAGCQVKRHASIKDACIQADIGRLVGKELGKEVGITDGCQAKRQAGQACTLYRLAGKELTKTEALQHASLSLCLLQNYSCVLSLLVCLLTFCMSASVYLLYLLYIMSACK
jgi:hypothetical protein